MASAQPERSDETPAPAPPPPGRWPRRALHLALGLAVGAAFLAIALWKVDVRELRKAFLRVDLTLFFPILAAVAAVYWLKAVRWAVLLRPLRAARPLAPREVFPAVMIGFMANNLLPAHLGEFVRMYVLAREHGLKNTSVLSTIVLERTLDFLAVIAFLALSFQLVPLGEDLKAIRTTGYLIGAVCGAAFLLFLAFALRPEASLRAAEACLRSLERIARRGRRAGDAPSRISKRVLELLALGIDGLRSLESLRAVFAIALVTLVHWALNGLGLYLSALSFAPRVPLPAAAFLLSVTALGVTVPSAPGYLGTLQICFILALGPFGIPREEAFAASVYWTFFSYVPVTLAGYYFLGRLGLRLSTVGREADAERTAGAR